MATTLNSLYTSMAQSPTTWSSYLAAVDTLVAACKAHGKVPGMTPFDEAWASDYMRRGFRMVAWSSDTRLLRNALSAGMDTLRRIEGQLR